MLRFFAVAGCVVDVFAVDVFGFADVGVATFGILLFYSEKLYFGSDGFYETHFEKVVLLVKADKGGGIIERLLSRDFVLKD